MSLAGGRENHGLKALGASLLLLSGVVAMPARAADNSYPVSITADPESGLKIARGFRARVFASGLKGRLRHIAARDNGDIYVGVLNNADGSYALRDSNGDGAADVIRQFGDVQGTGVAVRNGYVYVSDNVGVYRYKLDGDALLPGGGKEVVVSGFTAQRQHAQKNFAIDDDGNLYVNNGAPANACMEKMRTKGSPGMRPCPLLEHYGGIWRFDADRLGQTRDDPGAHFATGLRNGVALAWNPVARGLYLVMHGRDQLHSFFPDLYDDATSAELPAEEFHRVNKGDNLGWPYSYYDHRRHQRMVMPEYGGDGETPAPVGKYKEPLMAFPGHWAPNGLLFYAGDRFPAYFRGGAFIAFHGSWNRAPLPQKGYKVVFVPFRDGAPAGGYQVFADYFMGADSIDSPGDAKHRPMGLAEGPAGEIYIADSAGGTIWRIDYTGG